MKLLDVNVWLAATWARHRHHGTAKRWLDDEDDVAMCRVTQMALLRLVTNPAVPKTTPGVISDDSTISAPPGQNHARGHDVAQTARRS